MRPTTAVAVLATLAAACSDEPEPARPAALCDTPYQNLVDAAPWAQATSPIRSYYYSTTAAGTFDAEVRLLGADDEELGTVQLEQVYGDPVLPDGAMRAELDGLTLVSTGRVGPGPRHEVHADLTDGTQTLRTIATFEHRRCFDGGGSTSPACAGELALGDADVTLPSCGLIADNLVLAGVAPTLTRLEYRAPDSGAVATVGGRTWDEEGTWHQLVVRDEAGTVSPEVGDWAVQVGADAILGSATELLLTTAFLDRTWWRTMDEQVAWCTLAGSGAVLTQALGGCGGGDCSANDWNQGGGSGGGGNNAWGDPHMTSLDGHSFDFQGGGEFVLVRGTGLEIQMRTEARPSEGAICSNVTWATAVAADIDGVRIGFYTRPENHVTIDGELFDPASSTNPDLPDGAALTVGQSGGRSTLRWPDGSELWVTFSNAMKLGVELAPDRAAVVEGLLGDFDGQSGNDLVANGEVLPLPASFNDIHGSFAETWRVDATSTLFDYETGEDTSTFARPGFPTSPVTLDDLPLDLRETARTTCLEGGVEHEAAMSGCILDTVCAAAPGEDAARPAREQPVPVSHQPPGEDVLVGDAVERKPLPASIDDAPRSSPADRCEPRARRHIALYREAEATSLTSSLDVGAALPGRLADTLTTATLASGTSVDVWLLHRAPGDPDEVGLEGFARFSRPILGVLAGYSALAATDTTLGGTATYDAGSARGVELDEDWIEISADRRQIRVRLTGSDLDQVRVLTEVTP